VQFSIIFSQVDIRCSWFGSGFIYARINLNLYMETGQKKMVLLKFSFSSAMILNTEFEHMGMNTAAVNGG